MLHVLKSWKSWSSTPVGNPKKTRSSLGTDKKIVENIIF